MISPAILSVSLWISSLTLLTFDVQLSHGFSLDLIFGNWYSTPICESTCQLSMTCWMSGGVIVPGLCSNYFQSCCYHNSSRESQIYAQPRKIRDDWEDVVTNSVEVLHELHYGPVRNDPMCGLRQISRRRIVGGQAAGFGVYPWQAMIKNQNKSRCGGALISHQHIVTAGHCVSEYVDSKKTPVGIVAYLGEYSLYEKSEPLPLQKRIVTKVFIHPYYQFTPQADRYDVAVLKLDRPVKYAPHIVPVCLPNKNEYVEENSHAMVSGWGARDASEKIRRPRQLQAVDVKIVDSRKCEDWHRSNGINLSLFEDMMCAGHEEVVMDSVLKTKIQ